MSIAAPSITIAVRLTPERRAFSAFVRSRLAEVDTHSGVIVEVYPNSQVVAVRFPPLKPHLRSFDMDVAISDLEASGFEVLEKAA